MEIRPVGVELYHVGGRVGGNDKADSRFPQFWNAPKTNINVDHIKKSVRTAQ